MAQLVSIENGLPRARVTPFHKYRKRISRMLVGIRRERNQRFHLAGDFNPGAQAAAVVASPRFRSEPYLHRVKRGQLQHLGGYSPAAVNPVADARKLANRLR